MEDSAPAETINTLCRFSRESKDALRDDFIPCCSERCKIALLEWCSIFLGKAPILCLKQATLETESTNLGSMQSHVICNTKTCSKTVQNFMFKKCLLSCKAAKTELCRPLRQKSMHPLLPMHCPYWTRFPNRSPCHKSLLLLHPRELEHSVRVVAGTGSCWCRCNNAGGPQRTYV